MIELLVTISIVSLLAGLLLGVTAVAAERGREVKTEQMITRLHTLLMEHYDSFRDRRVELNDIDGNGNGAVDYLDRLGVNPNSRRPGEPLAIGRLGGAREQMKMEMPDRWSDFTITAIGGTAPGANPANPNSLSQQPVFLRSIPPLAQIYRQRYAAIWNAMNTLTGAPNTVGDIRSNQGAECLYMVITFATGDGEARGLFKESDIGDTDGDGAPEFLDGWGNPIQFLRWAPGRQSDLQLSIASLPQVVNDANPDAAPINGGDLENPNNLSNDQRDAVVQAITDQRDPIDLFRVDQPLSGNNPFQANALRGFRLTPLIYSAGRDEELGTWNGDLPSGESFVNTGSDPYSDTSSSLSGDNLLGDRLSEAQTDNITNHLISAK